MEAGPLHEGEAEIHRGESHGGESTSSLRRRFMASRKTAINGCGALRGRAAGTDKRVGRDAPGDHAGGSRGDRKCVRSIRWKDRRSW